MDVEARKNLISKCDEHKAIGPLDDGYMRFFTPHGALRSDELRVIADELDSRNLDWHTSVLEDLAKGDECPS